MMADFVVPRHNAVMERLRRRIELYRRHHTSRESHYDGTAMERLEVERQQTFALYQRGLQTKSKRSSKHRQPQPASEQAPLRGSGPGVSNADITDSATGEQSRNSTLIALQESVKKRENAGSPIGGEANGFGDGYPPSKKVCLEEALSGINGTANGALPPHSPLDTKHSVSGGGAGAALMSSEVRSQSMERGIGFADPGLGRDQDFRLKEMKQEPMDDIHCMLPTGGSMANNNLFPDLTLNEQEWKELMEEFNRSVAYEDIQDIFNDSFKDPDLSAHGPLPSEPVNVKTEFSPASAAFDQEPCAAASPQVRPTSSGPPMLTSSPVTSATTASSPTLSVSQPPRPLPPGLLMPGPPSKKLSPAQQLQQLAEREQQREQLMQTQQKPSVAKYHPTNHQSSWPQATASQSPLAGAYGLEKPSSPSIYQQDFPKQLLLQPPPNKSSPKSSTVGYPQGGGHPSMLGHTTPGVGQASRLDYNNTKPLTHYQTNQGPRGPPQTNPQNKVALMSLLRQQQMKQTTGLPYRPHRPLAQDQNSYPAPPHAPGPATTITKQPPGGNLGGNHGDAGYLSSPTAALEQQKQFLLGQRQHQHLIAQQEKRQQLQRHLTRPPPQYQDQQNPQSSQNPFQQQQQQVTQFTGSQPMSNVGSMGEATPGGQRIFPQAQGMTGMGVRQSGGPAQVGPPAVSLQDMNLPSCGGRLETVQQALYSTMSVPVLSAPPVGSMSSSYRQNLLVQQHVKSPPNQTLIKQQPPPQQHLARMPAALPCTMASQTQSWQLHQSLQPANRGLPTFSSSTFPIQPRHPKLPINSQFAQAGLSNGRPLAAMSSAQMMATLPQQRTNPPLGPQAHPQALAPPPQSQQQGQQVMPGLSAAMPDISTFGQSTGGQVSNRAGLQCNQGYQVSRNVNQEPSFDYSGQSGNGVPSFPEESDLVDSLLKNRTTEEWMDDLDELLANHQ